MYLINKNDILKIAEALMKDYELFGPVLNKESAQVFFDRCASPSEMDLKAPLPYLSPKEIVFPQMEKILSYDYNDPGKKVEIKKEFGVKPKALFGIRSCDLTGLLCMDRFFLGQEYTDEIFLEHRKKMFIVSNTCVAPFKQCFCACTDSGPSAREGFDLNLTEIKDHYLVETGSPKGEDLAAKLSLKKADDSLAGEKKKAVDKSLSLFEGFAVENKAWISRVMNRVTTGFIDQKIWEYIGEQCFECGACSFVCPSCTCFNIEDVNSAGATSRLRTWDSCSYEGYTRMAGDHNPRKPVEDRRNKRFFCKLSYSQSKKYLRPGCVGCGRCVKVCPGDIGLPNVVTYIRREITE